mmetsp:Transcript_32956/g.59797  ORF Transcript_32956/g.59797 Transcript_32956/m.59797 type:complete len:110 (-) Transcript_32956:145-474(-)|eukprot:CAMPEP_0197626986 /NCGR_PEP_ID=MMETSP1338-20131121/5728_1 /TAXON_ID=43686 ORGANISM="Pelagodinium beii, Strain RCC1491" /NCGR_SAMPLE_ID=MMETSP1338 /ASSEMBLY_ACC=CAM_ASM_000754 /LENGTH=109 /DNA_ID=CAMNT_0043197591 /DNA_START=62 /DNA_END=394 /DNA_ORIENTATION=+
MVLTTLGRTAARAALKVTPASTTMAIPRTASVNFIAVRRFAGYDYNMGIPGSRIRNPDPAAYNDVAPPYGFAWWALIVASVSSFFWGNTYDLSRGVNIAIGLFGPNMPL